MFEPQLYEEFGELLQRKLLASQQLEQLLARVGSGELRENLARLHACVQREVQLSERLVELVS